MTTLPDVSVTIQDGSQGLVNASGEQATAKLGTCSAGTVNTLYSYSDIPSLVAAHGAGPLVEAAAHTLAVAGGPVYIVRVAETTPGAPGSVTQVGTGPLLTAPALSAVVASGTAPPAVTLTGTPTKFIDLVVEIVVGGARATATVKYSIDGGDTFSTTEVTAATIVVPNTGVTLNFAVGTYDADNAYAASSCVPFDAYELKVEIVDGGILGTSTFRYSLDALNPSGASYSATYATPVGGSPTFIVPGTGITLTFAAGTYVAGDTYSLAASAPAYTSAEVITALAVLTADPREWGAVHLVGQASTAAGSASMASVLDTQLEAAASGSFRYSHAILEAADVSDALLIAGFASFASKRVNVCAGFARVTSSVTGRGYKRSAALPISARLARVGIGVDLGRVIDGALPGVTYLHRDEQVTTALDAARFSTLRSLIGRQGYYITNGRIMAAAGSDFRLTQYRRVMDRACSVAREALLNYLNGDFLINANGTIYELDARGIEAAVTSALNAALTQPRHASAATCVVDRTNNVRSTEQIKTQIRVTPLGYAKSIDMDIGFTSPALTLT